MKKLVIIIFLFNTMFILFAENNRELIFYLDSKGITGHVFVYVEDIGTYGFYPVKKYSPYCDGILKDDHMTTKSKKYKIFINEEQFENVKELVEDWLNNPPLYIFGHVDCVSFVMRVADIVEVKYDKSAQRPKTFLKSLKLINQTTKLEK